MSLRPKTFFCRCICYFPHGNFFCQLKDPVCRVGALVWCKGLFGGCGGTEKTTRHQRGKESEAEGYIVIPKRLGTPTSLSVLPVPATPLASAFSKLWLTKTPEKDTKARITEHSCPPPSLHICNR